MTWLCPTCGRMAEDNIVCRCGTDLQLLHHIVGCANRLFNQAVTAYEAEQPDMALAYLEASAALLPLDEPDCLWQAHLLELRNGHQNQD